ncbi:hypothetical protein DFH29DRAFT_910832 [Suillus ampliporus]|nr:hypothetical protein DFH29DRAFT_910832 [Suillus ampliporus]
MDSPSLVLSKRDGVHTALFLVTARLVVGVMSYNLGCQFLYMGSCPSILVYYRTIDSLTVNSDVLTARKHWGIVPASTYTRI